MTDKQIIIKDYFNILRDEYNRIYCIQNIGDPKSLIKAIREQNEYIQAKEQELQQAMDNYVQLDLQRVKEYNELVDLYKAKEQKYEELKKMNETGLQQWVDMYNKADKERFEALLQRDRYKQALDEMNRKNKGRL